MVRMYNPMNGVVVYVTTKFISRWMELGFMRLNDHIILFPPRK